MAKTKGKTKQKKGKSVSFPARLVEPVAGFLHDQLKKLERRKKDIKEEDPFSDESRVTANAAPDTEAEEQFGHARTSAIRDQLDRKIIQTKKALSRIKLGKYGICENCGKMIDTDRLMIYPEATFCVSCEKKNGRSKNNL